MLVQWHGTAQHSGCQRETVTTVIYDLFINNHFTLSTSHYFCFYGIANLLFGQASNPFFQMFTHCFLLSPSTLIIHIQDKRDQRVFRKIFTKPQCNPKTQNVTTKCFMINVQSFHL